MYPFEGKICEGERGTAANKLHAYSKSNESTGNVPLCNYNQLPSMIQHYTVVCTHVCFDSPQPSWCSPFVHYHMGLPAATYVKGKIFASCARRALAMGVLKSPSSPT